MPDKNNYDVVVIGGGIAGLTCGALLAKNGLNSLVVEQGAKPGGLCSSFEIDGFKFDNGIDAIEGLESGGAIYQTLTDLGLFDQLELIKVEPALRIIGKDYDFKLTTPENLEAKLIELFPMESDSLRRFFAECQAVAAEMTKMAQFSPDLINIWQKIAFAFALLFKMGRWRKYAGKSSQEVVAKFFSEPKLRAIILSLASFLDPGAMAVLLMSTLGVKLNCYYPVGGAQKLADLLVQGIVNYNSELALNTLVGRILIENKKAIGVELASGEEIRSKWVISNADARQTFIELVGETALSPKFIRELAEARLSSSAFLISLGTTLDLKSLGFDGATVIYNPTDDPEELFGADLEKHLISIKMHSLLDPSQSPRNMSAIQIMMMLPYDFSPGWEKDKEAIADKLIASAEEVIPNLTDYIICREITTPLTLEGTTLNSQGAIGWYPAPRGKMWRQKAPIKNLYQAGQWTFPGAGVPNAIASGRNATQLVLRNR